MCNLTCFMCIRQKMTRKKGTMSVPDFKLICSNLNIILNSSSEKLVSTNGFGEPLIDKRLHEKISHLKRYKNTKIRILSSGIGLSEDISKKLINSGLDEIIFSFYGSNSFAYKTIHGFNYFDQALSNIITFAEINKALGNAAKIMVETINFENELTETNKSESALLRKLLESQDIVVKESKSLIKWWDTKNQKKLDFQCPVVDGFRKSILQITWEGDLIPCCNDYDATIKFGNLKYQSIDSIMQTQKFKSFCKDLRAKNYEKHQICMDCSNI